MSSSERTSEKRKVGLSKIDHDALAKAIKAIKTGNQPLRAAAMWQKEQPRRQKRRQHRKRAHQKQSRRRNQPNVQGYKHLRMKSKIFALFVCKCCQKD